MIPRNTNIVARRLAAGTVRRPAQFKPRFNSTATPSSSPASPTSSLVGAGLVGGGITLVGAYAYYHFSGAKATVDTAKSIQQSVVSAKDAVVQNTPAPNEVIKYLRGIAKSCGTFVPGASSYIDASFDELEELQRTHKDEVNAIINKAYSDIKSTVQNGGMDAATASKVYAILREQSRELGQLAQRVGADVIGPVLDRHPEIQEKLGGGWSELQSIVKDAKNSDVGKQAQDIYNDTTKQLADVFNAGFSAEAIAIAKSLVDEKSQQIKELSEKAARTIYEKGQKEYGDKIPDDLKSLLSDQNTITTLASGSGATVAVASIWSRVKDIAGSKAGFDEKSLKELKDLVRSKLDEAKKQTAEQGSTSLDAAWKAAESWLKSVPGGQKALDAVPDIDIAALSKIATSRGDEAKQLAQETYSDVLKVLKEKADRAKSIGEGAKDDVKGAQGDSEEGAKSDKKQESGKKEEPKKKGEQGRKGDQTGEGEKSDKKGGDKQGKKGEEQKDSGRK